MDLISLKSYEIIFFLDSDRNGSYILNLRARVK